MDRERLGATLEKYLKPGDDVRVRHIRRKCRLMAVAGLGRNLDAERWWVKVAGRLVIVPERFIQKWAVCLEQIQ